MTDINIFVAEIATLFDKQFDNPFNILLKNATIGYRATILKQEYDKNGRYPPGSEDSLVLPLKMVSPIECCCGEDMECRVNRTKDRVPSAIRGNFKPEPFLFVGTSNGSQAFTHTQPHIVQDILTHTKFIRNDIYYAFYNDYLYTFNYEGSKLMVRDVFSNPLELMEVKNCDGKPCIDTIYIEDDMKRIIKQMLIEEFRGVNRLVEEQEAKINE